MRIYFDPQHLVVLSREAPAWYMAAMAVRPVLLNDQGARPSFLVRLTERCRSQRLGCLPRRRPVCRHNPCLSSGRTECPRHADQRQVALFLADDFVAGSERNQVGEAFQRHAVTIVHMTAHRFGQGMKRDWRMLYSTTVCDCSRMYSGR